MPDLVVICPSFKRPKQANELLESFHKTREAQSELWFALWLWDPTQREYAAIPKNALYLPDERMVPRTNAAARLIAPGARYMGWVADDNRFRTKGWDRIVIDALDKMGGGVVFGNDVQSPGSKPSHVFLSSEIVRTLGWLHHPDMQSTFGDDVWEHLGKELGKYKYLPEVTVEHLYTERDNTDNFLHDIEVFQTWVREEADDDIARVRRALRRRNGQDQGARSGWPGGRVRSRVRAELNVGGVAAV